MPTPNRNFRIPDDVYWPAMKKADQRGESLTNVVARALRTYAASADPKPPEVAIAPPYGKWHRSRGDGSTFCGKWVRDMTERATITEVPDMSKCRRCWPKEA